MSYRQRADEPSADHRTKFLNISKLVSRALPTAPTTTDKHLHGTDDKPRGADERRQTSALVGGGSSVQCDRAITQIRIIDS